MIPNPVTKWLGENNFGAVKSTRPVSGGCISNGKIIITETGQTFFLKTNPHTPADMFAREAEGLRALRIEGGPTVPKPFLHSVDFILLEDLAPASRNKEYWPEFGRRLAALHQKTNVQFGFAHDNYIGSTEQPNTWTGDGYTFFAEQRLLFQATIGQRAWLTQPK